MDFFSKRLLKWYKINQRKLPWRLENDPYKIWLSEIILQQTQVKQGLSYYYRFVNQYPTINNLAKAPLSQVMKLWQGLGYYSRARNLHESAKHICLEFDGKFPKTFEEIIKLKGVGDYTASAISSFAYNLPHAVVDGNVYRVLSRVFKIDLPIDSTEGKKVFKELAQALLPKKNSADYNQAIMEFGATYCKPQSPNCLACIFNDKCLAYAENKVAQLPFKLKQQKIKNRFLNYFLIINKGKVLLRTRKTKDIWNELNEFVLIESVKPFPVQSMAKQKELKPWFDPTNIKSIKVSDENKHVLSHQHLYIRFIQLHMKNEVKINSYKQTSLKKLDELAWPKALEKYLRIEKLIN